MKLKIPPAIVTFIFGSIMWIADQYFNNTSLLDPVLAQWVAMVLLGIGATFGLFGLFQFYKHSTSIDPHKPDKTSSLVTDGIYRISRNPMYVGLLFVLAGYGFYVGNLTTLLILPLFVKYMNRYQIIPEEKVMCEKFKNEYLRYKSEVPRWLW